jgi:AraC-like DNA-binding protein
VEYHALLSAGRFELGSCSTRHLQLIHAHGRGAQLDVPAAMWSLWLPVRGELQLQSGRCHWTLPSRHLLVARESLQANALERGTWLVLAGSQNAWNAAMRGSGFAGWLPRQWPCSRPLLRLLVQLARLLRDGGAADTCEATLSAFCVALQGHQHDLQALIDRCNGRTPQRRYLTMQRLMRVHQWIERTGDTHPDLTQLARIANYSPWHLIRMYREVFGETPSEHVARVRLARAWAMVRDSAMPVNEITERLGFESQSAFCRAFKSAYGLTTTQARQLPASIPVQPRPCLLTPRPAHARLRCRPARTPLTARHG